MSLTLGLLHPVVKKKNEKTIRIVLLLFFVFMFFINQLPFLTNMRPVMYDEAWYGNTAYNLSVGNGLYQNTVGSGGNSNSLFPLIGALFIELFGYSLISLRLASVFCGFVTLLIIHFVMNEFKVSLVGRILALVLFVSLPLFNTAFRFARPESASMMCLSGGILFYSRYWRTHSWSDMACLGTFCVLATNAHPFALYSFMFFGVALLIDVLKSKEWRRAYQLLLFFVLAIIGLGLVMYLTFMYNEGSLSGTFLGRASLINWRKSAVFYFKELFMSKQAIGTFVTLFVLIGAFVKLREKRLQLLALMAIINGLSFPFVFTADLLMVGYGWNYVSLISVVLVAPFVDSFKSSKVTQIWIAATIAVYSMGCLFLSYYYNYKIKYEKCNTVLTEEISNLIPSKAVVYGPLRQWFCVMGSCYYSDHYRYELPDEFDYLIFNEQDLHIYENNAKVMSTIESYDLIYSKATKQYGEVTVYRKK